MSTAHGKHPAGGRDKSRMAPRLVFLCFLLLAGFYLWTEHRAHLLGWWPYLLILLCPLLHFFHGHGGHGNPGTQQGGPHHGP